MSELLYTVVQHSGYGYAGKPGFDRALETRLVWSKADQRRVEKVGGLLLTYQQAEDYCEDERVIGKDLYPAAQGTFSDEVIDGLRIYVPIRLTLDEAVAMYEQELDQIRQARAAQNDNRPLTMAEDLTLRVRKNETETFLNVLREIQHGH